MTTTDEYIAIGSLVTICASALALVIKQVESSRCTKIKCCGLECDRRITEKTQEPEEGL